MCKMCAENGKLFEALHGDFGHGGSCASSSYYIFNEAIIFEIHNHMGIWYNIHGEFWFSIPQRHSSGLKTL